MMEFEWDPNKANYNLNKHATLHDWPVGGEAMINMAQVWPEPSITSDWPALEKPVNEFTG
jgi:hypothetical protein